MKAIQRGGCKTKQRPISSRVGIMVAMTRTVTPVHFCVEFPFNRLRAGGVQGGCKCLDLHQICFRRPGWLKVINKFKIELIVPYRWWKSSAQCLDSYGPHLTK